MFKSLIISGAVLLLTVIFTITNSTISSNMLGKLEKTIESSESSLDFQNLRDSFDKAEKFLSLSIPDSCLWEIENCISDIISYQNSESDDEVEAGKSRLLCLIRQQRRLSGFNIKSIF